MIDNHNTANGAGPQERLAAALDLAERRHWYVFPANSSGEKKSHKAAEYSPGHRRWGCTRDPDEIRHDFTKWPDANLGVPTGVDNKVFVLDVDTLQGHKVDGIATLRRIEAENGVLSVTLMARSPTGSLHYYFKMPADRIVGLSTLGDGIDVKGEGGMVIAPPSVLNGGAYEWLNDNEIADAPQWLLDMVVDRVAERPFVDRSPDTIGPNVVLVPDLLAEIDPNDLTREEWFQVGCAVFGELGSSQGREVFRQWSSRGSKYDAREDSRQWNDIVDRGHGYNCSYSTLERIHDKVTETDEVRAAMLMVQQFVGNFISRQSDDDLDVVWACDITPRSKFWLWKHHLLIGALELMTGLPDQGKSQIHCSWAASVTTGKPWPDGARIAEPGKVLMLTAEDALDDELIPRLIAAGADMSRIAILKSIRVKKDKKNTKRQFLLSEDLEKVQRKLKRIENVLLITVDPITAYMGKIDSHRTTDVRNQLGPLKDFAEQTKIAISAITHPAKAAGQKAIDQFIGSQAFIAACRLGHVVVDEFQKDEDGEFEKDEDGKMQKTGRRLLCHAKHNPTTEQPAYAYTIEPTFGGHDPATGEDIFAPHVVWGEAVKISADDAVADASHKPPKPGKQEEIQKWLRGLLRSGPMEAAAIQQIADGKGYSEDQLNRAKRKLGVHSEKIGGSGEGWVWQLPDDPNSI